MSSTTDSAVFKEEGFFAGERGDLVDSCRYRRADKRAAWMQGWHEGDAARVQRQQRLTPEEADRNQQKLGEIRKILAQG